MWDLYKDQYFATIEERLRTLIKELSVTIANEQQFRQDIQDIGYVELTLCSQFMTNDTTRLQL